MELLDDELRRQLPAIRKMHSNEWEYTIYAKLFTRYTGVTFYVAEGEQRGNDYMLWGFLIAPQFKFPSKFQITAGRLLTSDWLGKEPCRRDEYFEPTCWGTIQAALRHLRGEEVDGTET